MKKLLSLILSLSLILTLTACGNKNDTPDTGDPTGTPSGNTEPTGNSQNNQPDPNQKKTIYVVLTQTTTVSDTATGEVLETSSIHNTYDDNGVLSSQEWINASGTTTHLTVETDEYGRITLLQYDGGSKKYTYDAQGNTTCESVFSGDTLVTSTLYTYDANGNMLSREVQSAGNSISLSKYTYENGLKTRWEVYKDGEMTQYNAYEYDANGRIVCDSTCTPDGIALATTIYTHSADGLTVTGVCERWKLSTVTTVDEHGNTVRTENIDAGQTKTVEYTYLAVEIPASCPRKN